MLRDRFGRDHDDLRISVTDRCNLRCGYCMPESPTWFPRAEILTFEEIVRLVRVAQVAGVRKLRVTGGEPLVRRDLPRLVRMLAEIDGIEDLSLTTNGVLLPELADPLAQAGLRRINVSLDSLSRERFRELTRRDALERVLLGLRRAAEAGLGPIKVNTVLLRGGNEDEVERLVERARSDGWELRFIEFMPLANGDTWDLSQVVRGEELRERIGRRWPLERDPAQDPHAPATRWIFRDGGGRIGFIDSVSRPFCSTCSRIRLTADGRLRVCLYDDDERDLRALLRAEASDAELLEEFVGAIQGKRRGGALELLERSRPAVLSRTMHQIGG